MSEKKVSGIPENEKFWEKAKRKARTAGNWCKTHWKGIALGAVAIGGGAYMLTRNRDDSEGETGQAGALTGSVDYREAIAQAFDHREPGDDVGPDDDEPDVDD